MPYDTMLQRPEVERLTGLSRSSIYALMSRNEFPRPHRLSARAVAWKTSLLEEWLHTRPLTCGKGDVCAY
jgi:prophage regulatory protein